MRWTHRYPTREFEREKRRKKVWGSERKNTRGRERERERELERECEGERER